jgi:[NiFe] hydrogenase diaphorase moiety large subunit
MKDNMAETQESVIREICGRFGNQPTRLMDILLEVHRRLGSVSGEAVDTIAATVKLPRVEVESTLSFYAFFSPKPRGKFVIRLCNDIIDQMHGADRVGRAFREELGIDFGQTTADGLFTLEHAPCIGMCDQAPAALINDKVVTNLSSDRARELVEVLRTSGDVEHLKLTLGNGNNSHPLVRSMVRNNLRERGPVIFAPLTRGSALRKALAESAAEVIKSIKVSRLRGRGGAGFPTGMKWEFARAAAGENKIVVCNADEGEPGTFKDRVILTEAADLVFEGMTIAGYGVGAATGIVYLRGEYAYLLAFLENLLKERRDAGLLGRNILGKQGFDFDIRVQLGAGAYICGEETALLSSCEGKRGDPKNRPPFPAQSGYLGRPTVINNVETFCCVARILENGPGWFSSIGTNDSTGTKLYSVSGDCDRPGVYELPFGVKIIDLLAMAGAQETAAVQVGGASGQMIGPNDFGRTLRFDDLATGGAVMIFNRQRDVLRVAEAFMDFFVDESCGYCTPCRVGNRLLRERLGQVASGKGSPEDLAYLKKLGETVKATSRCGLGQTSAQPVLTTLRSFRPEYERRVRKTEADLLPTFDGAAAVAVAESLAQRRSVYFGK